MNATCTRLSTVAVISLLGDANDVVASARTFEGRPVLARTIDRIAHAGITHSVIVLAWSSDAADIQAVVGERATVRDIGPRRPSPWLSAVSAALRWADGWRGGLLGTTEFDRGFDASAIQQVLTEMQADSVLLVSPAAAFVEPVSLQALVERLEADATQPYAFVAGPVGTNAMLLRREAIDELARGNRGPGSLLTYHPDRPTHDPLAKAFAIPIASRVARALERLAPDGSRVGRRLSLAQAGDVETLVASLESDRSIDPLPREVVIDLTTRRVTRPIWTLAAAEERDLPLAEAAAVFAELAAYDPATRITFGGRGDPLLHPSFREIIAAARSAGLTSLHVETDLLPTDPGLLRWLAQGEIDIVSVHLPAATRETYKRLMNVDRIGDVLANFQLLLTERLKRSSGLPLLVPTFLKCIDNFGEMETWYDQWIRAVGTAVIAPPSDLAGRIPFPGIDDLTPSARRPCRRLSRRLTIRSDGRVMPCEEAIDADHSVGDCASLGVAWTEGLAMLRSLHAEHRWDESELCRNCRMWDRP